jgi:hypothetical protein
MGSFTWITSHLIWGSGSDEKYLVKVARFQFAGGATFGSVVAFFSAGTVLGKSDVDMT